MRPHILHSGLHRIGDRVNHFIDPERFLGQGPFNDSWMTPTKRPLTNLRETDQYYELEVALPGFSRDEITLSLRGTTLTVEAQKRHEEVSHNTIRHEFSAQSLKHSYHLPSKSSRQDVEAKFDNGILSIRIPSLSKAPSNTISVH